MLAPEDYEDTGAGTNVLNVDKEQLIRIDESIMPAYTAVFPYEYFNVMQSSVLEDALFTAENLVVSAPTGCGKTGVLEMAIVQMLSNHPTKSRKAIYMAPTKALCNERCMDWSDKFGSLDVCVKQWTGDTQGELSDLKKADIIITTPEKWHSTTKRWRDREQMIVAKTIGLVLIDEAHHINDVSRGAMLEACVSRMKTMKDGSTDPIRFLAVSATIPNVDDLVKWLGSGTGREAKSHTFGDEYRPVPLQTIVEPIDEGRNFIPFVFDSQLNKLVCGLIVRHNRELRPTLVFCSTRKSTKDTASTIVKERRFVKDQEHKRELFKISSKIKDDKQLADFILQGVAYHHGGLSFPNRNIIEAAFKSSHILVLTATSTLAVGVNLPAHLVVIKNTQQYVNGGFVEYDESQVLQMIGRAGRPQYDTYGKAVILTRVSIASHYTDLASGQKSIESHLHKHITEHLNAEVSLGTVTDVASALAWLQYSFLYVRVQKDPARYGLKVYGGNSIDEHLQKLCLTDISRLANVGALEMSEDMALYSTPIGNTMAKWSIAFDTVKLLKDTVCTKTDGLSPGMLLLKLANSKEFTDIVLRNNEKKPLGALNRPKKSNAPNSTVRYPINVPGTGCIKTSVEKVSCLSQCVFGSLDTGSLPFALSMEIDKIMKTGQRIAKFLLEMLLQLPNTNINAVTVESAMLLSKAFQTRLWWDTIHIGRQFENIGRVLSTQLVERDLHTFESFLDISAQRLEQYTAKGPPFGSKLLESIAKIPIVKMKVLDLNTDYNTSVKKVTLDITLENHAHLSQVKPKPYGGLSWVLLVKCENEILFSSQIYMWQLVKHGANVTRTFNLLPDGKSDTILTLCAIDSVGLDTHTRINGSNGTGIEEGIAPKGAGTSSTTTVTKLPTHAKQSNGSAAKLIETKKKINSVKKTKTLDGYLTPSKKPFTNTVYEPPSSTYKVQNPNAVSGASSQTASNIEVPKPKIPRISVNAESIRKRKANNIPPESKSSVPQRRKFEIKDFIAELNSKVGSSYENVSANVDTGGHAVGESHSGLYNTMDSVKDSVYMKEPSFYPSDNNSSDQIYSRLDRTNGKNLIRNIQSFAYDRQGRGSTHVFPSNDSSYEDRPHSPPTTHNRHTHTPHYDVVSNNYGELPDLHTPQDTARDTDPSSLYMPNKQYTNTASLAHGRIYEETRSSTNASSHNQYHEPNRQKNSWGHPKMNTGAQRDKLSLRATQSNNQFRSSSSAQRSDLFNSSPKTSAEGSNVRLPWGKPSAHNHHGSSHDTREYSRYNNRHAYDTHGDYDQQYTQSISGYAVNARNYPKEQCNAQHNTQMYEFNPTASISSTPNTSGFDQIFNDVDFV